MVGAGVNKDMKVRLYVSLVVVSIVFLYISPLIVILHGESIRKEFLHNCTKESMDYWIYCLEQSKDKAQLHFLLYLLPYIPVGLLVWTNWIIKPDLRLRAELFPVRTIRFLLWLGIVVAILSVVMLIWQSCTQKISDFRGLFILPWLSSTLLFAPVIFNHLLEPIPSIVKMQYAKVAMLGLAILPILGFTIFIIRSLLVEL